MGRATDNTEWLRRRAERVEPGWEDAERQLREHRPLRVKLGIDPTDPQLHIGHLVPVLLLRDFQQRGHIPVLIIGDYTARIGDPSGKDETRPALGAETVRNNAATYLRQLQSVLDIEHTEVHWQTEWFSTFSLADVIRLLSSMTVSKLMEHKTFRKRLEQEGAFFMHEALYPLLQAYDSVAVRADVELGAVDQLFNIMTGRTVQKFYGQPSQTAILTPYILGTDGRKMSKSLGNTIGLTEAPLEIFGKAMAIPDDAVLRYARLITVLADKDLRDVEKAVDGGGLRARDAKRRVAFAITSLLHGEEKARSAAEEFDAVFLDDKVPSEPTAVVIGKTPLRVDALVLATGVAASRSEARRLVKQRGVSLDGATLEDSAGEIVPHDGSILRIGKRHFFRLSVR